MTMRKIIYILICWTAVHTLSYAGNEAPVAIGSKVMQHADYTRKAFPTLYLNPAFQYDRYDSTLNTLSAGCGYATSTKAQQPQLGSGYLAGDGLIDAFLRKGNTTLWGHAYYGNGQRRHVAYNETSDYALLYPYVMADTVGGSWHEEQYDFIGGFARRYPGFTIGAQGEYAAALSSRTVDPRPKNLTGDLKATVGISIPVGIHSAGVSVRARKYKQTNEVEFYSETGKPVVYHLTGLGNDYYRFRGDYTNTYYNGYEYGASIGYKPVGSQGLYADASFDYLHIKKIITSLNELPLAVIKQDAVNGELGYIGRLTNGDCGVRLHGSYKRRTGTENIFGNAENDIYPQISQIPQYRKETFITGLGGFYQYRGARTLCIVTLDEGYHKIRERYLDPLRKMDNGAFVTKLSLSGLWQLHRWMIQTIAEGQYEKAKNSSLSFGDIPTTSLVETVYSDASYLSHDRYGTALHLKTSRAITPRYDLFLSATWQYAHYMSVQHANRLYLSVGMDF